MLRKTAALAGMVLAALAVATTEAAAAPPPVNTVALYLSPTGNDRNSGTTEDKPLRTLDGVQSLLKKSDVGNVQVLISAGTYEHGQTDWTYDKNVFVTFEAHGNGSVVFTGRNAIGDNYWFQSTARKTCLRFKELSVTEYNLGGIYLINATSAFIEGMRFTNLGNRLRSGQYGRGGVHLRGSSHVRIRNNRFENLENSPGEEACIHGVYLAVKSRYNQVVGNQFNTVSGDPVRVRDGSDDNTVEANTFSNTGYKAILSDWQTEEECQSFGNFFTGNKWCTGYKLPCGKVNKIEMVACLNKGSPCGSSGDRFITSDNTKECGRFSILTTTKHEKKHDRLLANPLFLLQ